MPFGFEGDVGSLGLSVTFQTKPFGVYGDWMVWQEQIALDEIRRTVDRRYGIDCR
jgi:hypothetical protein